MMRTQPIPAARQADFARAYTVARQHIPVQIAVAREPNGFVIMDEAGERFGVYDRNDYDNGQKPGSVLSSASPLKERENWALVGYVRLDGTFWMAATV